MNKVKKIKCKFCNWRMDVKNPECKHIPVNKDIDKGKKATDFCGHGGMGCGSGGGGSILDIDEGKIDKEFDEKFGWLYRNISKTDIPSWIFKSDEVKSYLHSKIEEAKREVKKKIEGITLNKSQSTTIFGEFLKNLQKMKDNWTYKAPEVINLELKEFIWDAYVTGRVDEKDDILKAITKE